MAKSFFIRAWKKLVLATVVLSALVFFFVSKNKSDDVKKDEIRRGDLKEVLVLSGEVNAVNYTKLYFETVGKVSYVGVKEGDVITKGKLISKLDTTVLNSSYQTALANLRIYEATLQNVHDQVKDNDSDESFAQKDSRTTAEANKDKAYEAVIIAKRNLDGASLYAPFSGIVTYLAYPFTGVYSGAGAVAAEIIDPSTMYFQVLADQTEVTNLSVGMNVKIVLDAFEDKEIEGTIENISFVPKSGETGSVYSIKVAFKGVDLKSSKFKIAMTGDAEFVISQKSGVLYIPDNFLKTDKTGKYIKLDAKGKNKVYVETGIESDEFVEIIGDVSEGQSIYD